MDEEEFSKLTEHEKKNLFGNKKPLQRILVLSGGVLFNIICAFILFTIAFMYGSTVFLEEGEIASTPYNERKVIVAYINDMSPLKGTQITPGDVITGVVADGVILENEALSSYSINTLVQEHNNSKITFFYKDKDGANKQVDAIPQAGIVEGKKIVGARFADSVFKQYSLLEAIPEGIKATYEQQILFFQGMYKVIYGVIFQNEKLEDNLAGPIGLAVMTSKVASQGISEVLLFAGMISISLAGFNILPIPALDGGRIVFVLAEVVRRKKFKATTEQLFHGLGFFALLCLMVFVTYFDIVKAFN